MKKLLLTIAVSIGMTSLTMAQNVPNYVPTNGLVGWWPFNGNANDESGNGNNGTNNGATLTTDRFGNSSNAYNFNGLNNWIDISSNNTINFSNEFTISIWVLSNQNNYNAGIIAKWNDFNGALLDGQEEFALIANDNVSNTVFALLRTNTSPNVNFQVQYNNSNYNNNDWNLFTYTLSNNTISLYKNGSVVGASNTSGTIVNYIQNLEIGRYAGGQPTSGGNTHFNGNIDDIGIWNRALTQQEITDLYNATNCANNTVITPQTNAINTGSTATFIANTTDPNPSYIWQSDFGQGYVNLNNYGNYSGTNIGTINIANVQLPNHTQPIRVITTSGNCVDTSNVAIISITDTCINTITDTTFITVTDTLVINTTITGLNPPNNANTIKVFPNPTNDHITINYGNFSVMNGYQLKIENSLGQQVFQTNIAQQSDYLNLTTWGGNGLYFVHIIDPQGNTIDIRKIVLQ